MSQRIVLVGSGEFTPAMVEVDKYILRDVGKPVVAIVPTAAGQEVDWWKWVDMGVAHFARLRIEAYGVDVRNREDAMTKHVGEANVVYFSGGDPGYLVGVIKDTPLWKEIEPKQVIVGSSAGAMLLGKWVLGNIYPVFEQGATKLEWLPATGMTKYTVWPHFDYVVREEGKRWKWLVERMPVEVRKTSIGIDEDTTIVLDEGVEPIVMGRGKAHWDILW